MGADLPPIWIGANYSTGGVLGRRVVLIGESTYAAPGVDTSQYNRLIPLEHMGGTYRDGFPTRLIRMLLGAREGSLAQVHSVWQSVAFFNYITVPLPGPGEAPTELMWERQHQPLDRHLSDLRPEIVLLLSFRLWDRLTARRVLTGQPGPTLEGAGRPSTLLVPVGSGAHAVAYGVKHPSYISWQTEHGFLSRLLRNGQAPKRSTSTSAPRLIKRTHEGQ